MVSVADLHGAGRFLDDIDDMGSTGLYIHEALKLVLVAEHWM